VCYILEGIVVHR